MAKTAVTERTEEDHSPTRHYLPDRQVDPGWSHRIDDALLLVFVLCPFFGIAIGFPVANFGWLGVPLSTVTAVLAFRTIRWFCR